MQNKNSAYRDIAVLCLGEIIASALTVAVFYLLGGFSYKVVTGTLLGTVVSVFNYLFLIISVNRAVDRFMALRGDKEMDDEEAEKFAAEHGAEIRNAQKLSYIVRTFTMMGALVLAFISGQFDAIATVVPLLLFQPILIVSEFIRRKGAK